MSKPKPKYKYWDGSKMIEGYNFHICADSGDVYECSAGSYGGERDTIPGSSEQIKEAVLIEYTGLKDKTGAEIYDGDLVEFLYKHPEDQFAKLEPVICQIYWHPEGAWCLKWFDKNKTLNGARLNPSKYTVVGNIYQNKDLVK